MKYLLLFACSCVLTTCASYQASVDSRSVGVAGSVDANGGSGKVVYTVHYR